MWYVDQIEILAFLFYIIQRSRAEVRKPFESLKRYKNELNEFIFTSFKEHVSRYKKAEYIPQECEDYEVIVCQ